MDTTLHPAIASWLKSLTMTLTNYSLIGETIDPNDPLRDATLSYHAIVLAPLSQEIQDYIKESGKNPMDLYSIYKTNLKTLALSNQYVRTAIEISLQKFLLKANNLRAHFKLALCAESKNISETSPENFNVAFASSLEILSAFSHEIDDIDREIRAHLYFMNRAARRIQKVLSIFTSKMVSCDQCGYKTNPTEVVKIYNSNVCTTCHNDNQEGYDSF